jgi:hypothetical protein
MPRYFPTSRIGRVFMPAELEQFGFFAWIAT